LAKVTDFGLASFLDDANSRFNLTSTHVSMGTLSYMAPEQRVDAKNADKRADIFSLGVILYELLTGEVPLGTFDPPSKRKPGIDPQLDAIIARCLKPDPDDRYATVAELMADLEPLAPAINSQAPQPITRFQRLKLGLRRVVRVAAQAVAVVVVVAALGVLGVAWHRNRQERVSMMPGAAITGELGAEAVRTVPGWLEKLPAHKSVSLGTGTGTGPDQLSFLVAGRAMIPEGKALVFPPSDEQSRTGRAVADVVDLEGDIATLKADVLAAPPPRTWLTRVKKLLLGPPPDPQVALLLVGSTGRYVALVQDGAGAPLALEWALGERRGTMLVQSSPDGLTHLSIQVNAEGVLTAFVGKDNEKRPIGEPLIIGRDWQKHFGEAPPRPAAGCIEGTCRVEGFSYVVKRAPPAAPPAVAEVARPQPAPPKQVARPPSPPPKKSQPKAPPPKGGKRPR
ncbi:MAG: protein kinase, partial [Myxococcaceae bacterium]|nr:protein kinase [Myxococcaceae bacterium]